MEKKIKVILDTNIWISFLITKTLEEIDELLDLSKIVLLFSDELLTEFIDVTSRDKLRKYFDRVDISKLIDLFDEFGILIDVKSEVNICRDIKDNFLLALAKDGKADYIVTGDHDLLVLKEFEETKITNPIQFKEKIK